LTNILFVENFHNKKHPHIVRACKQKLAIVRV